jgi:hypothetical protein
MRAEPMKLLGLNLSIPFTVRSGFAVPAFVSPACAANLWERCTFKRDALGVQALAFKAARHHCSGRFRNRKLVGSGQYSKCFFAAFSPGTNASRS